MNFHKILFFLITLICNVFSHCIPLRNRHGQEYHPSKKSEIPPLSPTEYEDPNNILPAQNLKDVCNPYNTKFHELDHFSESITIPRDESHNRSKDDEIKKSIDKEDKESSDNKTVNGNSTNENDKYEKSTEGKVIIKNKEVN